MLVSAALIGSWVTQRIEDTVVRNTANATALYMDSYISPLGQDLARDEVLPPGARKALDEIFLGTALGERVASYKLRNRAGTVVAASDPAIVGTRFEMTGDLQQALAGRVVATFEDLSDAEDQGERALGLPLLEIYSPIREVWSGRIIGVAEFYEVATELQADLASARRNSWIQVVLVLSGIGAMLYLIVLQGSRTIVHQQATLKRQLTELRQMSDNNTRLRLRVQKAAARTSALHDRILRQVGADLHDGPAQLMGYAALRLDALRRLAGGSEAEAEIDQIESSVRDAMVEIRQISRGLSLPDIENRQPCEILRGLAEAHTARTGAPVSLTCDLPGDLALSPAARICLYRFAQEGLANGWRHGGGAGQALDARLAGGTLTLAVRDQGKGFGATGPHDDTGGMGLAGLRDRVESLGGTFRAGDRPNGPGAELVMELEIPNG